MVLILKKSSFQKKSRTQFVIVITYFVVSARNLMFLPSGDMGGEINRQYQPRGGNEVGYQHECQDDLSADPEGVHEGQPHLSVDSTRVHPP